jgi:hypothetical protein
MFGLLGCEDSARGIRLSDTASEIFRCGLFTDKVTADPT